MRIFRGLLVFGMMDFTPIIGFLLYSWGLSNLSNMIATLS
jgi:YggT family protein